MDVSLKMETYEKTYKKQNYGYCFNYRRSKSNTYKSD